MGTKRPFDEDLQEFIKHPKHLEIGNKPDPFVEEKPSFEPSQNAVIAGEGDQKVFETSAPLPFVTGIPAHEEASGPGPGPGFYPNLFSEFYEFNLPRRPLAHYDDTYSSLLDSSPRKEIPVGPEHQANVPEFDSDSAQNYASGNERVGICVISHQEGGEGEGEGEIVIPQTDCKCVDKGSITCVQQHVNEARLNLKQSFGLDTFINLGFDNMGEEVSGNWTEEDEQRFQDIVYSNPVSLGKRFWEVLSIEFPTRSKNELVSYYFNVFIYRRRAVQNRSHLLAIDSDDDEWWGPKTGLFGPVIEDENDDDDVIEGPFVDHEDDDIVTGVEENRVTSNTVNGLEKPVSENGSRSESYLHWDPPYSTMGSTKGVDLLPTCSMIEEIFGSSKTSKST